MRREGRRRRALGVVAAAVLSGGCAAPLALAENDQRVQVVTTTALIADLVRNVGGSRVNVVSIVPPAADPHTYEPSLRDVRDVVYADVAFSNYLLLEPQSVIRTIDANLRPGSRNVSLAEDAIRYGAEVIPLVEDRSLDTIWLGLRVSGRGEQFGATRLSEVRLSVVGLDGPGDLVAYVTGAFGEPEVTFSSRDGFDDATGFADDTAVLPPAAHTHMSWAFTAPGVYRLHLAAQLVVSRTSRPRRLSEATVTFAVGANPRRVPGMADATVLDAGHADIDVDLSDSSIGLVHNADGGSIHTDSDHPHGASGDAGWFDPSRTVVAVPTSARTEVPAGSGFGSVGRAGTPVYLLPQAVLGRHVHGEIDPHLWHDVDNAIAYVKLIRDALIDADPGGAAELRRNADAYIAELDRLDDRVRSTIGEIPRDRRHLVTTHDAFRYLATAYGLDISGFVTPNPAAEPSLADRRRLTATIRDLDIGAVFLEPNLIARSSLLTTVAEEEGLEVCRIYGDTFDADVDTYIEMMDANARSLRRCLSR